MNIATVELRIETDPQECVLAFDNSTPSTDIDVCSATVTRHAVGLPETLLAIVTLGLTIPINLLSNWIYEQLKSKKPNNLYINNYQVELNEECIRTLIEDIVTKHNQDDGESGKHKSDP